MELPVLSALRATLPEARITGIASPPADELLEGDPRIDRVVRTSRWDLRHRWDGGDQEKRRRIASWVAGEQFDLFLDASHATVAVGRAIWSLGVRSLESDRSAERGAIRSGARGVEAIRAGVRAGWGMDVPSTGVPELRLRSEDHAWAAQMLESLPSGDGVPFAISPVASHSLKRWPAESLARVADHIAALTGGPILVLEGPQPEEGRRVVASMDRREAAVRIGPHHLLHTAALLARCRGVVANDTGMMHLAAAVAVPTVGVFGPTRSRIFLPPGSRNAGAEPSGLECEHRHTVGLMPPRCWKEGACLIAERSCIHQTPIEDVIAAVDGVLNGEHVLHPPAPSHGPGHLAQL